MAPLRGVLYDTSVAGPLDRLLSPPYDVISPAEREALFALSPYNSARLILPGTDYEGAAALYGDWSARGVLKRDAQPAIYRYEQVFDGITRTGFICGVRLRRFDERVVLPHERTMSAPKADRLKLWRACRAIASQIFGLYSDPSGETALPASGPPELSGRTADGTEHRFWRIIDPAVHARLAQAFAERRVYIADGHHRYETMLALREEFSGLQFGPFFLMRFEDPGLRVLATHRVLFGLPSFSLNSFLEAARAWFTVAPGAPDGVVDELARRGKDAPTIAVASGIELWFLSLRNDADLGHLPVAPVLRRLDVTLLHALLLEGVLGIDKSAQEKQTNLRYLRDPAAALREARGAQAAFLLNPTRLEDLRAAADAGEVLPQKSTYFFPKIASGLVIMPVDAIV
ncbi:MAG: DUF1015 domain-containing protein [Myxococcales bacterium]